MIHSVATSGQHVFCINRSVLNMNSKKGHLVLRQGLLSSCPVHMPHDAQGWKSGRELARSLPDLAEVQHLFFLPTWRLGRTCT